MLSKDIAELMKLIQSEEARATQKIKADGPAVKGLIFIFLFCFCTDIAFHLKSVCLNVCTHCTTWYRNVAVK